MPGSFHIPAPYTYRNPFNETDPATLAQLCVQALEEEIRFQGANTIAAMIMEPILGAGGVIAPHKCFVSMVRDVCDRYDILLITDEVITAFGRTGAWSGACLWRIRPDMIGTAKAITNGYFPFGAVRGGHGLMTAIEMVSDRSKKTPIDSKTAGQVQEATYKAGAMIRVSGPTIILSPPLVLSEADINTILTALDVGFAGV